MKINQLLIISALVFSGFIPSLVLAVPSSDEYWNFAQTSNDRCINILIKDSEKGNQFFIYNGEEIKVPSGYVFVNNVTIGDNRLGYIAWKSPLDGGVGEVFVDGKNVGSVVSASDYNPMSIDFQMVTNLNYHLQINKDHITYLRFTGTKPVSAAKAAAGYKGNPIFDLIFDDKNFGVVEGNNSIVKLNGDYVIYVKEVKKKLHVFANTKDLGVGFIGDFDGKNKAVVREGGNLLFNDKKISNISNSYFINGIELKKGVLAFSKGNVNSPSLVYKGKTVGKGYSPKIEGKNLGYIKGDALVYNKKVFSKMVGNNFSLANNNFAFVQKVGDNLSQINISGEVYGNGGSYSLDAEVQISDKQGCVLP